MNYYLLSGIIIAVIIILILLFKHSDRIKYRIATFGELSEEKKNKLRVTITQKYEDSDVVKFETEVVKGIKDGEERLYYPTGELNRIQHWKSGKLHGETIVFYKTGICYIKSMYFNGKLTGEYTIFKPNGMILKTINY